MVAFFLPLLVLLCSSPASAFETRRTDVLSSASSAEVAKMLLEKDHEANLRVDGHGDPMLSVTGPLFPYQVLFYGCREGACETLQLLAWWEQPGTLSPADVSALNRDLRDGRFYLDADGNPTVDLVVHLTGGITPENLSYVHERFLKAAARVQRRIGEDAPPRP